jgi:hypothetical protein
MHTRPKASSTRSCLWTKKTKDLTGLVIRSRFAASLPWMRPVGWPVLAKDLTGLVIHSRFAASPPWMRPVA